MKNPPILQRKYGTWRKWGKNYIYKKKQEAYVNFLFVKKMASVSPYNYISENPFSSRSFPAIIYFFLTVFRCFLSFFPFGLCIICQKPRHYFFLPPLATVYLHSVYTSSSVLLFHVGNRAPPPPSAYPKERKNRDCRRAHNEELLRIKGG